MQLVERHIIKNSKEIDSMAFLSKNLYNYSNYILRQVFTKHSDNIPGFNDLINSKNFIGENALTTRLAHLNQIDYKVLPPQTSQQIIKLLYKNWNSFFKAIKDYKKNPQKYRGRPSPPKYKDKKKGRNIIIFTNQNCRLKGNKIYFPKKSKLHPIKTKVTNFCQVRIVPQTNCYVIEVVYEKQEVKNENLKFDKYISIDLGVNNVCAITSNQNDIKPFLINGKPLKSINQYYNKTRAQYQSMLENNRETSKRVRRLTFKRNNKVEDALNKISCYIIKFALKNNVGNIVIGYNKEWKQEVGMRKNNNQNFVNVPHKRLIDKITYKAKLVGISIILNEESYTSKCDALALEPIKKHENYMGKRIKRGMFRSSTHKYINADINGSLNILRKVIGDDFVKDLVNRGVGLTPYRVSLY